MALYGNVAGYDWEWRRYNMARQDPKTYFSLTITPYDNPWVTDEQVRRLMSELREPSLIETEIYARRPLADGSLFRIQDVQACIDHTAYARARQEGTVAEHIEYGCYLYQEPPQPDHVYVLGADPGTDVAPNRNKWVIIVIDLTTNPPHLVGFEMGHPSSRQKGDIRTFWLKVRQWIETYTIPPGAAWVEATGNQSGLVQMVVPEGVTVTPVSFNRHKLDLIYKSVMLIQAHRLTMPYIPQLINELTAYAIEDRYLVQDCVMALACAVGALWPYVDVDYAVHAQEEEMEIARYERYDRRLVR